MIELRALGVLLANPASGSPTGTTLDSWAMISIKVPLHGDTMLDATFFRFDLVQNVVLFEGLAWPLLPGNQDALHHVRPETR